MTLTTKNHTRCSYTAPCCIVDIMGAQETLCVSASLEDFAEEPLANEDF